MGSNLQVTLGEIVGFIQWIKGPFMFDSLSIDFEFTNFSFSCWQIYSNVAPAYPFFMYLSMGELDTNELLKTEYVKLESFWAVADMNLFGCTILVVGLGWGAE